MEKQEEWRPVVGYEGFYEVSNWGRVRSQSRRGTKGVILKPIPEDKGYLRVKLYKNGEKSMRRVHILVMRAFVGECPDEFEIDHIDWNPENNMLGNLRYLPAKENASRKSPEWYKNNAAQREKMYQDPQWKKNQTEAVRKAFCKPIDQYTLDGTFVKTWSSAREIEREFGISNGNISECCKGKRKTAGGFIWKYAVCSL